jgi:hypothetical protein
VLARFGVSSASLRDVGNRFSHELAVSLLDEAVRITGDPDLALHVAEQVPLESLDLVLYLGRHCDTLRDAFDTVFRHHKLLHERADAQVEVRGAETWIRFGVTGGLPVTRQAVEFGMALSLRAVRRAAGVSDGLERALFAHPRPAQKREHERISPRRPVGGARRALCSQRCRPRLRRPIRARTILERRRAGARRRRAGARRGLPPVVSRVREAGARAGRPQLSLGAARRMGLRAHAAGGSPGEHQLPQLDDVPAARALELLAERTGSERIAHALGFSDASAFRRVPALDRPPPASHPALARLDALRGP